MDTNHLTPRRQTERLPALFCNDLTMDCDSVPGLGRLVFGKFFLQSASARRTLTFDDDVPHFRAIYLWLLVAASGFA
jgi:hypothetical protein